MVNQKIICGDCLEIMKQLQECSIDFIITDPPYNWKKDIKNDNMEWADFEIFFDERCKEMYRVLKEDAFIVMDIPRTKLLFFQNILSRYFIFYDYLCNFVNNSMANCAFGIDRFNLKIVLKKGNPKIKRRKSNVVVTQRYANFNFLHPTQKDVRTYRYIMEMFVCENNIILDPFMGSGTSALCAKQLNCNYLGIDIEKKYCDVALKRLEQKTMFDLMQPLNVKQKEVKSGENANDDGIPPSNELLGILPNEL
jgi:site-specific DNA-methyltransferase (adenine-specific)